MRAGIGLIALLMGVALMFYLMTRDAGTSLAAKKQAEVTVNQISGKDSEGRLATDSLKIDAGPKGAKVLSVEPNGAFAKHFGIRAGDTVVEIGPYVPDQFQDEKTATAFLHDAYARDMTLVVQRDGQRVTLPQPGTPAAAQPTAQDQLNALMHQVPTH